MNHSFNPTIQTRHLSDKLPCSIDFSTLEFPARDQFDVFREAHRDAADGQLISSRSPSFPARQVVWDLNTMIFTYIKYPGASVTHRWRHLKRPKVDHWYLMLPFQFIHSGKRDERPAASPSLHCLAKPFEFETSAEGYVVLFVPRDTLGLTPVLDQMANAQFDGGIGSILADYLLLLNRSLSELRITELPTVVEATRSLLAACMAPSMERLVNARNPIDMTLLERARVLIGRRLLDRDLSPESICRDLRVSRSRLYRLFEPTGGIYSYIRRQRMLQARDALSDNTDMRPVGQIAEHWGFVDPSAFSRSFKHEFGMSPKEARMMGWDGNGHVLPKEPSKQHFEGQSLGEMLRTLAA
ncbi:helix-turn-helix transcriptional regulator [Mesorhizobium koreense]|jgi:AraC-like DNA-binding protein|uniref:helix-turn-helix transcriptional regulator n=1 Tax=Mesorhizobium koreense TaxID=3074855 RepID=UPI00287B5F03|nr:helix-turn-helix domain-containing protein [Mesorhizobium sp. WR6]